MCNIFVAVARKPNFLELIRVLRRKGECILLIRLHLGAPFEGDSDY